MALLRMLNRAAFICNVCFVLAICMLRIKHPVNPGLASLVIVMGFLLSILLNVVVNVWLILLRLFKKSLEGIPPMFIYINGGFLAVQLILIMR